MALQEEFESEGNWLFRYRSYLPLIILAIGLSVYYITVQMGSYWFIYVIPHWLYYEYFCLAIGLLGAIIRIYAVGHTPSGTSGRNTKEQVADSLNTTGIYSVVRHPLYLGNFLMWLGIVLLTCNMGFILSFMFIYWLYYERIMYAEEQFLRRKFGMPYLDWAEHTPAFIPQLKKFVPPVYPFSWKKVIKKEKNGIFALLLIFSMFNGIGSWLNSQIHTNWVLFWLACFSGVAYFILKYIKKRTQLLNENGR
ncbi:isoprenylcysteine carboxylmethyltransferase family protein [Phocaeicola vulgatus]|uniref:methyltransferase family protein n=1 Tax=Phocaeicola vulgatus TaxID=821 RepID=UPI00189E739E|nr:isoprenylcysteine carboxylmethyltransferase family protein [Phocaeicola vulgatus]MDB1018572.1 isoprenylcysteine carboxylmethyltransferase family protein [Phocaeicola vulgatus]